MPRRDTAIRSGVGAAAIAAVIVAVYGWLGVVNGDEGWYVLCARLVGEGRVPYRDFAFTQGPLYLYLLAPFVRLVPGVYTARAISVVCTAVAVGLLIAMARRAGGKWGAIACGAALLATIPSLPYWLSVTKTYALSCLFLAAVLFVLMSPMRPEVRFPLAAALAVGFFETRTTGIALAVLVIAVLFARAPDLKTRVRVVLATVVTVFPFVFLVLLEWTRARWGLLDYHQLGATGPSGIDRFVSRTSAAAHAWPGPFALAFVALGVVIFDRETRARMKRRPELTAFAVGIVLFVLVHEAGGAFFSEEYLAPVIAPIVVVSTLILVRATRRTDGGPKSQRFSKAVRALLVIGIVATAATGGHRYYLGAPGWRGDPAGANAVVRCVQQHSTRRDTVFALSLEEVVAQANRKPVPGVTLGMFSYEDVSSKRARELKILNSQTLGALFRKQAPKVLVLTVDDIFETKRAGFFSNRKVQNAALYIAFQAYKPVCKVTLIRHVFEDVPVVATVYVRPNVDP